MQVEAQDARRHNHPFVWRDPETGVPATMVHTLVMQHLQPTGGTGEAWDWGAFWI
jgi:hypothetical protein